ncbi:hypothetical protein EHI8A_017090 [Entamoeba histolytica HM-1:IMSS-B]|uniref:Ras guanine nucleotide exchange factor glfB-like C-terminal domain-containing protein n=6 Tax=Entamoeba histolytica TaxID=5759 RepID=C4LXA5_ENTH1|nr:hypothetical protein EHI_098220 [Entamoeba histolytica HM-1:IMSS]EMD47402.1 Hypothetical protein EHI5A_039020 [Entamoeba histolytica KU27]EMH78118.1 hypothetical protein EHI8A_017090 [Entamoeba histolytica HM-1:IMSS-B]EMS11096.1 hypothetical protein KM1_047550 [Entamoeba histolytica HM-3:IMSS]ENY62634.1 hypothetical protein EHI7A_020730 [Entamoeba histolytica HM-1:IMSS-A]GAT93377.1 hypothetical protein CL6EHI_098220 [Entamoeba histolytica]|eukprot:XP_653627.1 hypothetical protein EHI_098220 [Entamoeba histolytica HM-1:IMSS]
MEDKEEKKQKKHGIFSFLKKKSKSAKFEEEGLEKEDKKEKKEKKEKKRKEEKENERKRHSVAVVEKKECREPNRKSYAQGGSVNISTFMKSLPDWQESTRRVITDCSFETFPIAGDLPRLLKHLSIVREVSEGNYDTLFPKDGIVNKTSNAGDCLQVITCVTQLLEGEEQAEKVEKEWNETIVNDQDMSVQKTFLIKILKKVFVEETENKEVPSPVITFLKAINQKIIANSTMHLKIVCGNLFFKDSQPMFWEVACILQQKTYLIHYRKQETTSKNPEEYFRFLWELRLVFNSNLTQLEEVTMGISCIEFKPETTEAIRTSVLNTLKSIQFTDCQIKNVGEEDDQ